jgi:hypothetical protein
MTTIEAIETTYAGCRFRSRLEARWAVLFDHMGIKWQYEPQGYEINVAGEKRPYLPDFWLDNVDGGTWCEVKGSPEGLDLPLLAYAAHPEHGLPGNLAGGKAYGGHRLLILGPIPPEDPWASPLHCVLTWRGNDAAPGVYATSALFFGPALIGTDLTAPVLGPDGTIYTGKPELWATISGSEKVFTGMSVAYRIARMARFEHGERPQIPEPLDLGSEPALVGADVRDRIAGLRAKHSTDGAA